MPGAATIESAVGEVFALIEACEPERALNRQRAVTHWRIGAFVFCMVSSLVCVLGSLRLESNIEDVFQWLPDETESRDQYDGFVSRFGSDDFMIVTWPNADLRDQRLDQFALLVPQLDSQGYVARVDTSRSIVQSLVREYRLRPAAAIERIRGLYLGEEDNQGCAVLTLTENGMNHRSDSLALVKSVCRDQLAIPESDLTLAGYPVVGDYGDRIVRESLQRFLGPCCIISAIVAWFCLRNLWIMLAILLAGGLASGLSIAFVTLTGGKWGALSSVIPALAYLLSLSNSLHLVNYARGTEQGHASDELRVIFRVFALGWKPCVLSAMTTAAGMLSLCLSDYQAIREFGVYCAAGVLGSLVCQLVLMPVLIDLAWGLGRPLGHAAKLDTLFDFVARRPGFLVAMFLLVSAVSATGLFMLRSDLQVERNFSSDADVMSDIATLEQTLGPLEQTEFIISFADAKRERFPDRLRAVKEVARVLDEHPDVGNTYSAATWLPEESSGGGIRATAQRAVYRDQVTKARETIAETTYLDIDGDDEHWRISLRFPYFGETDFAALDAQVRSIAADHLAKLGTDASVQHTGVVLLYYVAQDQLVSDLFRNFGFAFLAITPLMIVVLQSFRRGLIAMIPNVCPAAISYGILGWIDYPVDIGMVMAACIGLGIAVDDTTHFMLRVDDLQRQARSRVAALRIAFGQCSRAMLHTTLISGLGLAAFLPGELLSMTRFTALLISILVVALLCDLILLPALLMTTGNNARPQPLVADDASLTR